MGKRIIQDMGFALNGLILKKHCAPPIIIHAVLWARVSDANTANGKRVDERSG